MAKGVAKHEGKKMVNNTLDDAGVVGDVIDKHTTTGPIDATEDKLNKTKNDIDKKVNQKR